MTIPIPSAIVCLLLAPALCISVGRVLGEGAPSGDGQALVANGSAEEADADGGLVDWSLRTREGQATLKQSAGDRTEGNKTARLEITGEDTIFDVQVGRPAIPRLRQAASYVFSADVKWESESGGKPGGYFCIEVGDELYVGKLVPQAGWQTVSLAITVPANAAISRFEFSGGSQTPAVAVIDNVRLQPATPSASTPSAGEKRPAADSPVQQPPATRPSASKSPAPGVTGSSPLTTAIPLQPDTSFVVRKILPETVELVRAFTHAPVDGRVDTRYSSGSVSEWKGAHGEPTTDYRFFNGNNGLHVMLAESGFDALQIRGGWKGSVYADLGEEMLFQPGPDVPVLCEIDPAADVFRRVFERRVQARRLSFFYKEGNDEPIADVTFLRVEPNGTFDSDGDHVTLNAGDTVVPDPIIQQSLQARFGPAAVVHGLGETAGKPVSFVGGEFVHFITPPQDPSLGIAAVSLRMQISEVSPGAALTVRIQDVLDPRREAMGVDFQVPGPGTFTVTLDVPDQAFLPPSEQWKSAPRLEGTIAPPRVLWMSIATDRPATIVDAQVTLHQVSFDKAVVEAGVWRKFLLKGLFKTMSEPRPWMVLDDKTPLRQQIAGHEFARKYETSLIELLENVEITRLLLPDDDVVRQYHEWLYQNLDRRKPQPPPDLSDIAGAPHWAISVRQSWLEVSHIARWWLDNRMVADGEFGGNLNDDTDLFQTWQALPMIESEPLGARLKDAAARLSDLTWNHKLEEGMNRKANDALHAYEDGINQLALCAGWFYGDPVHYERAMISARSVLKLMVETEDGRVHFGGNEVGIETVRNGYPKLGVTPGDGNWAPIRLMLHPVYVAAIYNRHPALIEKLERWGQTWFDYQKPGAYVGQVEILTGKPTLVSELPTASAVGPVDEWLALYQITGDPKWQKPFEMLMHSGGYWGTAVKYGRMPHALVRWSDPFQQEMASEYSEGGGYAGFFLNKKRSLLDGSLADSASWFGRFRYMHTEAEQKTDRVLNYQASTPISCYLGDAPNRNRWLNFTAVSYENLRGEDFAALVWDAGPGSLRVAIYNFRDEPLNGSMRIWRLDHGRYTVRVGPDADDDGTLDTPTEERMAELQRYSPIPLTLPPQQVTVVDIKQIERLDDIVERADVAVSPLDTRLEDGKLEVNVHNIGAKAAQDVRVNLVRGDEVVSSHSIDKIEAPLDLEPRVVSLRFDSCQSGDVVQIDPEDAIPEIAEHNNRLTVQTTAP